MIGVYLMEDVEKNKDNNKTKRKNEDNVFVIAVIVLLFITITIAYSLVSTSLNINGITHIRRSEWNVHFDNVSTITGRDLIETAPSIDSSSTIINFAINLNKPEDIYEFTVDAYNEGTVDAKVSSVVKAGISAEDEQYVDYAITYADGSEIQEDDFLGAGERRKLKVKVRYVKLFPLNEDNLDEHIIHVALSFKVEYVQN
jgi:hypothetical protein